MDKRVLFVDDDITSLDIMSVLFEKRGFNVVRSGSADQALECLEENAADVVVMDLMMPEVNGVAAVQQMRKRGMSQPVIAFTASNDPALHQAALDAGCSKVLTKPCKAATLVESVTREFEK